MTAPSACDQVCPHCGRPNRASRPRGLCWSCYEAGDIRSRYPSVSKYAYRGVAGDCRVPRPASQPTAAMPGTAAKVDVMAARAAAGEALWHPADAACRDWLPGATPLTPEAR